MSKFSTRLARFLMLMFVLTLLTMAVIPAAAQGLAPAISVEPIWRPATQLDSQDTNDAAFPTFNSGDDYRYVDAPIYVTTTVEFWTAQLTCTVNRLALGGYTHDDSGATPDDPGDDQPMVQWGPEWGNPGDNFVGFINPAFNATTGAMTFTASRLGGNWSLGGNGVSQTLLLATLRYRVLELAANTTSPLTCTAAFLDRNGRAVVTRPTVVAPPALNLITGHTLNGTILYQGLTRHDGITVNCVYEPDGANIALPPATTSAAGTFSLTNLRNFGGYRCRYVGNIIAPGAGPDLHLQSETWLTLQNSSYTLLPTILPGGNVDRTGGSTTRVDDVDLALITGPLWNTKTAAPFAGGDANGDRNIDRADVAIVASNWFNQEIVGGDHLLYDLPRDYIDYRNSRVWLSDFISGGSLTPIPISGSPVFWATLSPNGAKIAYVQRVGGQYALFTSNANGTGATRLTASNAWFNAFAPSWSPDGTQIAFICSWNGDEMDDVPDGTGWLYNEGDLCVVNANGRNLRDLLEGDLVDARIFPPAWLDDHRIVYGAPDYDDVCPDSLCLYDLNWMTSSDDRIEFDSDIPEGADMPIIAGGRLYYRYNTGSDDDGNSIDDRVLRWAQIIWQDPDFVPPYVERDDTPTEPFHTDVEFDSGGGDYDPITTALDYYDIRFNEVQIVFYEWDGFDFGFTFYQPEPIPEWTAPEWHSVSNQVGNPYWNGDPDENTDLHTLRNTVDWVP